jgi:hypothetical protein
MSEQDETEVAHDPLRKIPGWARFDKWVREDWNTPASMILGWGMLGWGLVETLSALQLYNPALSGIGMLIIGSVLASHGTVYND